MGGTYDDASYAFYPFTKNVRSEDTYNSGGNWDKNFYEFSEFIVYVFIIPTILYIVYRRYRTQIDNFINKLFKK